MATTGISSRPCYYLIGLAINHLQYAAQGDKHGNEASLEDLLNKCVSSHIFRLQKQV